jgi:hypothetical protein
MNNTTIIIRIHFAVTLFQHAQGSPKKATKRLPLNKGDPQYNKEMLKRLVEE